MRLLFLLPLSDTATITHRKPICEATLAHKLPTIFSNRTYLRAGGLMSYGPDLEGVFQRAAYFRRPHPQGREADRLADRAIDHLPPRAEPAHGAGTRSAFSAIAADRANEVIE